MKNQRFSNLPKVAQPGIQWASNKRTDGELPKTILLITTLHPNAIYINVSIDVNIPHTKPFKVASKQHI